MIAQNMIGRGIRVVMLANSRNQIAAAAVRELRAAILTSNMSGAMLIAALAALCNDIESHRDIGSHVNTRTHGHVLAKP